jgi:hypothetical protein
MKKISIVTLFSLILLKANAQAPEIEWQHCYGGTYFEQANSIQQTLDGGYIIAGKTSSNDEDVTGNHGLQTIVDFWIVKIDHLGILQWQKCLGGTSDDLAMSIKQTSDGGYITAGYTFSNNGDVTGNHGHYDYWVVKLNENGGIQWQKTYGGSKWDQANSIELTSDGGYIIAGYTCSNNGDVTGFHSNSSDFSDFWIVKINSLGAIEWQKALGSSGGEEANSIKQTSDGGYIIAGKTTIPATMAIPDGNVTNNHGGSDFWIVKLSSSGTIEWQKSHGSNGYEEAFEIQQTWDGGFIVSGYKDSDYWLVRLSWAGIIEWEKQYGGWWGLDYAYSLDQVNDGGFVLAGVSYSNDTSVTGNHGLDDCWVIKTDGFGNLKWQKSFGGSVHEDAKYIHQTSDGGFIIAGYTSSNDGDITINHGYDDFWIIKLYPTPAGTVENILNNKITVYPNPTSSEFIINWEGETIKQVKVFNLLGEIIFQDILNNQQTRVYLNKQPKGIYFVEVTDQNKNVFNKKIILE